MESWAPIFTPTMEEFKDFSKYMESIQHLCTNGICKIIPPSEWNKEFKYEKLVELSIPSPIKQYVSGDKGVYQLMLVEERPINVEAFQKMANKEKPTKSSKYEEYDSIERIFWKNIRFNPPTYGADMQGSLMGEDVKYWNMNHLGSILDVLGDTKIPGINMPYLYFGMWKAMFAWHVEDVNLFSINYLHFGEPKSWYAVAPEYGPRLERLAQNYFPELYRSCPEFLRHKTTLLSPTIVTKHNIPLTKVIQEKGQIVITFPYSYHCGFNHGFNCAESVNFALESWLEFGKKAKYCKCQKDTVSFDMELFEQVYKEWKQNNMQLPNEINVESQMVIGERSMAPQLKGIKAGELSQDFAGSLDILGTEENPFENQTKSKSQTKKGKIHKNPKVNGSNKATKKEKKKKKSFETDELGEVDIINNDSPATLTPEKGILSTISQKDLDKNEPGKVPASEKSLFPNLSKSTITTPTIISSSIHDAASTLKIPHEPHSEEMKLSEGKEDKKRTREEFFQQNSSKDIDMNNLDTGSIAANRKRPKKLTKEEEDILYDYLKKFDGSIPDKNIRDKLVLDLKWTQAGVYSWFKRRISIKKGKTEENTSHTKISSNTTSLNPKSLFDEEYSTTTQKKDESVDSLFSLEEWEQDIKSTSNLTPETSPKAPIQQVSTPNSNPENKEKPTEQSVNPFPLEKAKLEEVTQCLPWFFNRKTSPSNYAVLANQPLSIISPNNSSFLVQQSQGLNLPFPQAFPFPPISSPQPSTSNAYQQWKQQNFVHPSL